MFWQTRHLLNCKGHFWSSWMRQNSERGNMRKVCHSDSFTGHSVHCIEDAHRPLRAKQNGRAASDKPHRLTATQVAGPERLVLEAASACPALSGHRSVVLSTSGTFLPLGQSCVYFQGTVFFPGPSWPPSEGFWQRSTLHKRPGHSSCLSLIPSVSSC